MANGQSKKKNFNKTSTRKMRRAHKQPGFNLQMALNLAMEAGMPRYELPVTK